MKTLRYLLIICTLAMTAAGYSQAQFKNKENKTAFEHVDATEQYEFQSTSAMSGSGSNLPMAARNGFTVGANNPSDNSSAGTSARGPRRAKMDEDEEIDINTPGQGGSQAPVGDGMWMLLIIAAGYAGWMMLRRRRILQAERMA